MRIGLITGEYPPLMGGVGDYSATLAGMWAALGHEVHVLARPAAQDDRPNIIMHNVMPDWGLFAPLLIRHWAQQRHLDVVNMQYQTAIYDLSGWMHAVPRLSPVPVVTTFHDLLVPYLFPKAGRVRPWIVRELARTSAAAVTTNAEDFAQLAPLPNRHLIPIGSNIDVTPLSASERADLRATVAAPTEVLLAHFGFLYPNRGVDDLLRALHDLRQQGQRVRLLIIGGRSGGPTDSDYVAQLDALISELRLTDAVTWTGFLATDAVSRWLQTVDWVVLPFRDGASYRRGSLIAAIMHGCAVVTTCPTVAIDSLRDDEQLALVPPDNVAALTQRLLPLLNDTSTRQRYQTQIVQLRARFSWDAIGREFLTVFESVQRGR